MRDKFMKKIPHFLRGAVHAFGMPLYADGKGMGIQLDCLDRAVLRPGAYGHSFSGHVYCLVVETVYIEAGACVLLQPASPFDADAVAYFAAAGGLLHVV